MGRPARDLLGSGAPGSNRGWNTPTPTTRSGTGCGFPTRWTGCTFRCLLLSGWQDIFLGQTLQQYRHLSRAGLNVALTVGPWTHVQMVTKGLATSAHETLDWLDAHLGGAPALRRPSPVRVFVTGQGWRHLPDWPPATTEHIAVSAARRAPGRNPAGGQDTAGELPLRPR